jgi:hypothetical protein
MFNNYLFIIVVIIILAIIGYLLYSIIQQNKTTTTKKKKVTFIGVPNEAQLNKPIFRPRPIKKKTNQDKFRFNPFNNKEAYENYSITE